MSVVVSTRITEAQIDKLKKKHKYTKMSRILKALVTKDVGQ